MVRICAAAVMVATFACLLLNTASSSDVDTFETTTFIAVADTFITSKYPDVNWGDWYSFWVGWSDAGGIQRGLVDFDISAIPRGATVIDASLQLWCSHASRPASAITIRACRITLSWDEMTATWSSMAAGYDYYDCHVREVRSHEDGWINFDVRDLVQAWVDRTKPPYGIMLTGPDEPPENYRAFSSKEFVTGWEPRLIVDWIEPMPSPMPSPSPTLTPTPISSPYSIYLPIIVKNYQPLPPVVTPTPTITLTATPTVTPTPTQVPVGNPTIAYIRYETRDEYIRITNQGSSWQDMTGWKIQSYANIDGGCQPTDQWYTFPAGYILDAGASVRVHSGPDAIHDPPGDLRWTTRYIWNNDGDKAILYDSAGNIVDTYCYGECCP